MNSNLGRIEHLEAEDVERVRWSGADDLGEARDADSHELTARSLLELLAAQLRVVDLLHRELERRLVIPAVVRPARRRLVGKLLGLDEVLQAELGRIHLQLVSRNVGEPLYRVYRFGDAKAAALC